MNRIPDALDGGQQPGAELLLRGQTALQHLDRMTRQNRHSVPRLLAMGDGVVSKGFEFRVWKQFIGELELLKAHDIGTARF